MRTLLIFHLIDEVHVISITKVSSLHRYLSWNQRQRIGFVPTMGALHGGHLSLIEEAQKQTDVVIVSVYVNPTQFNQAEDLQNYPRTLAQDVLKLDKAGCDILFLPSDAEMYPDGLDPSPPMDISPWAEGMEGTFRPGHFDGMARVMYRFITLLKPYKVFMGQKDFQQFKIVDQMSRKMDLGAKVIPCPIIREENGLAMSSRNLRLSDKDRQSAGLIFETLKEGAEKVQQGDALPGVREWAMARMRAAGFRPEYYAIINPDTLEPLDRVEDGQEFVICTAAWVDPVRLIDNYWVKPQ